MGIGFVYGTTFSHSGMSFSAMGAFAAGSMWSLIALFRSPQGVSMNCSPAKTSRCSSPICSN